MVHSQSPIYTAAILLLQIVSLTLGHSEGHGNSTALAEASKASHLNGSARFQSYFAYPEYGGIMMAHIGLMTVAWLFVLPIGVMLSVARYRFAIVIQLAFLGLHSVGLLLGTIYRSKTPDLYKNNSHAKVGWIVTWLVVAQCVIGLMKVTISLGSRETVQEEQTAYLPIFDDALMQQEQVQAYRYSNDSGHFTASESSCSQSISSLPDRNDQDQHGKLREYEDARVEADCTEKHGLLGNVKLRRFASHVSARLSTRTISVLDAVNNTIDCTSLPIGFVAVLSGAVVYGGVFRGDAVFNGLAHSIKGGIFVWYGLLTLGRWMGCFSQLGWAWNVKPPINTRIPSAEFVESFVIFLYGASNVWLEHLAAWGDAWSAQDFEHVSISIMFFGGGLCGMLVESKRIREFLNATILKPPVEGWPRDTQELFTPPKNYPFSMNPFPGLIILLLGLMMSSHHQSSMVSTTVHKQWGMLFVGFALSRGVTYILTYISPPSSYLPSRPPSELISSFCLISGGLIFIASNKDTVAAMEHYGFHAMFPFTLTMGFTSFLMAWVIIVLAVKGWAVKKQQDQY